MTEEPNHRVAGAPAAAAAPATSTEAYRPWRRPLTYVVFGLGMQSVTFLMFFFTPAGVVFGFLALGFGIPAVLLANKEIRRHPRAAHQGFIRWGKRTGKLGLILGPLVSLLWILAFALLGAAATMHHF